MSTNPAILKSIPVRLAKWFTAFFAALQFLTIIPPLVKRPFSAQEVGKSVTFFPAVGLMIGAVLIVADSLLAYILPSAVSTVFVLIIWVLISGALHIDGFLDTCDGLFGGHSAESRLKIMRDERIGAFALTGGILLMLLKFSSLNSLSVFRFNALLLAPTLSRWSMVVAIFLFPYARSQGLGRLLKDQVKWSYVLIASAFTLALAWFVDGWIGIGMFLVSALLTVGIAIFSLKRIPGLTGDIYGAMNELTEVFMLVAVVVSSNMDISTFWL
jgi:adenosylcobinamide-GDP ribazoletransferase